METISAAATTTTTTTSEVIIITIHCITEYVDEIGKDDPNSMMNEIKPVRFLLEELPYPILFLNEEGIICYQNEDAKSRFGNCTSSPFSSILSSKSSTLFHSIFPCPVGECSVNQLVYLLSSTLSFSSSLLTIPSTTTASATSATSSNNDSNNDNNPVFPCELKQLNESIADTPNIYLRFQYP